MTKKLLLMLVVVLMVAACIVGCSTSAEDNQAEQPSSDTPATEAPTEATTEASQQEIAYPEQPIQVTVPAGAGGDTDTTARFITKYMEPELGVALPVVNMKGSAGTIATNDLVNSDEDGYKVLYFHTDAVVAPLLGMSEFKWQDTFEIAAITSSVQNYALVVRELAPYDDVESMIAYSQTAEQKLIFAMETGTIAQVLGRKFQDETGIEFIEIDVGGASEKKAALLGEQVDVIGVPYPVVQDYIANGDFKVIGIMADERNGFIPNVPTMKEQGIDVVYTKFFFFGFEKGTPQEIVDKFSASVEIASNKDEYKTDIEKYLMTSNFISGQNADAYIAEQEKLYQNYIDDVLK